MSLPSRGWAPDRVSIACAAGAFARLQLRSVRFGSHVSSRVNVDTVRKLNGSHAQTIERAVAISLFSGHTNKAARHRTAACCQMLLHEKVIYAVDVFWIINLHHTSFLKLYSHLCRFCE